MQVSEVFTPVRTGRGNDWDNHRGGHEDHRGNDQRRHTRGHWQWNPRNRRNDWCWDD